MSESLNDIIDTDGRFAVAAEGQRIPPDVEQLPVHWLLGVPLDPINLATAMRRIDTALTGRRRLVIATLNVNFLAIASRDPDFRECLLNAELSVADGMPLVWLGRLLGIPNLTRVAGSTLVERLRKRTSGRQVRTFFFGGDEGVADEACRNLAVSPGDLRGAGSLNPGRGSVEDLSTPATLEAINASKADFVAVALGAKKGHQWIERNRAALTAPVISHVGAAVGFLAGKLHRAPRLLQHTGFEWLWRLFQEPALARRYASDALFLIHEVATAVVPLLVWRAYTAVVQTSAPIAITTGGTNVEIRGAFVARTLPELKDIVATLQALRPDEIVIRLAAITNLDCASLGYLYELRHRAHPRERVRVVGSGSLLATLLRWHRATALVSPAPGTPVLHKE
jgi:N-acetylglucosaminyldiphosphoundecaprenol N-acetyl-beta-D-mannosaminyltransferase